MYSVWWPLLAALIFWLGILTYLIIKDRSFLHRLFPKSGERDIRKKFTELIKQVDGFDGDLKEIRNRINDLERGGLTHIQKVGLLRYNPFDDTGGDISFSLSLLDDKGDGLVVTSLHGRAGTRVFAKGIKGGKASKYQLSKEEEQVVKEALRLRSG